MNKRITASAVLSAIVVSYAWAAPSGKEIMTKNEEARRVQDITSSATLTTAGGGSPERTKQFTWWRKLTSDNVHFNTLTRFHAPAEVRGEGILFLEHENGVNDVMLYLPNFKKIRRVESQQQSGSFMGSEFSYSDIASDHVDDFHYKVLREEKCPTKEAAAVQCFVIEATPVNDTVKERNGYSKSNAWIRNDCFMAVQAEYFDLEGKLWKKLEANEIKEVDPAKHKWMAHKLFMKNEKNGKTTSLQFSKVKVNAGVPDSTFTQQNLSRVK